MATHIDLSQLTPADLAELEREIAFLHREASRKQFVDRVHATDWESASREEIVEAIKEAMDFELDIVGRNLANVGVRLYPDDKFLANAARVLAPQRVIGTNKNTIVGLNDSMDWIQENAHAYRDKWVGVYRGKLMAVADTREELDALLESQLETQQLVDVLHAKIP